jgi:hypothetical protein
MKPKTLKSRALKLVVIIALLTTFILPEVTFAQPPKWAPAHGYRAKTRHIYFPEHNFYYDIQQRSYFYLNGGRWTVSVAIPAPFLRISLGNTTQIQLDYYGAYPYYYNTNHRVKYKAVKVNKIKTKKVVVIQGNHHHNGNHQAKGPGKAKGSSPGNGSGKSNGPGKGNGNGKNK